MTTDPNAFLMGSGGRTAKFPEKGAKVTGYIQDMQVKQQTDFDSGAPLTWEDGKPRMELVVVLQTDERDDEEDDGVRKLYVKGQMQAAVADAVRKAGQRGLGIGGKLRVTYTSENEPTKRGRSPQKVYEARYEAPVQPVDDIDDVEPF